MKQSFHHPTVEQKPINMLLGQQLSGHPNNAPYEYMTSHRPAINYYVSSKSSNVGGDIGVHSSSSYLKSNLQHVHSFPMTNMGTITTPTNQNNSGNTSIGMINSQNYMTGP